MPLTRHTSTPSHTHSHAHAHSGLNGLLAIRALRPLRALKVSPSVMIVVRAMVKSIPGILNIFLVGVRVLMRLNVSDLYRYAFTSHDNNAQVSFLFFVMFATLGTSLFAGRFYGCYEATTDTLKYGPAFNKAGCETLAGHEWRNPTFGSFDNVFTSLLLLFEVRMCVCVCVCVCVCACVCLCMVLAHTDTSILCLTFLLHYTLHCIHFTRSAAWRCGLTSCTVQSTSRMWATVLSETIDSATRCTS
jgi:hypothetical protein